MSSLPETECPSPYQLALVEITCGDDNKIRIAQASSNGARNESSFDELATASRFLAATLQKSVDTIRIGGYMSVGELFADTRRAMETVSVRVLVIDPEAIHRELSQVAALLDCFRFDELDVHRKPGFSCWWKVPPAFIKQSADDVYEDLAWIECVVMGRLQGIPNGIPREFFNIPSVERLDFVRICPNEYKWTKRTPPKHFLALMDFVFEPPSGLDDSCMEPLEVGVGPDNRLPLRFVDDIVEAGGRG